MCTLQRSLTFGAVLLASMAVKAQSYTVQVAGYVDPCTPATAGSQVIVGTYQDSVFFVSDTVIANENCYYYAELQVTDTVGFITAWGICGPMYAGYSPYAIVAPNTSVGTLVNVHCPEGSCNAGLAIFPMMDGSSGIPLPFTIQLTNASQGGVAPITYAIDFGDGTTGWDDQHTYPGAGTYTVCLSMADASGCSSTYCDTLTFDADGNMQPLFENCWADFNVIQAYELSPDTMIAIPDELWIQNMSSGYYPLMLVWDYGDGSAPFTGFAPTHHYETNGPFNLCVTVLDGTGCTHMYCDSISVDEDGLLEGLILQGGHPTEYATLDDRSVGFSINMAQEGSTNITEQHSSDAFALWPNPATDRLELTLNAQHAGAITISILDMNGRTVLSEQRSTAQGVDHLAVDVSTLVPGLYTLRITDGSGAHTKRFAKVR